MSPLGGTPGTVKFHFSGGSKSLAPVTQKRPFLNHAAVAYAGRVRVLVVNVLTPTMAGLAINVHGGQRLWPSSSTKAPLFGYTKFDGRLQSHFTGIEDETIDAWLIYQHRHKYERAPTDFRSSNHPSHRPKSPMLHTHDLHATWTTATRDKARQELLSGHGRLARRNVGPDRPWSNSRGADSWRLRFNCRKR